VGKGALLAVPTLRSAPHRIVERADRVGTAE